MHAALTLALSGTYVHSRAPARPHAGTREREHVPRARAYTAAVSRARIRAQSRAHTLPARECSRALHMRISSDPGHLNGGACA